VSAKVKLATNSDGQQVAIKIYKNHENDLEMIQSELQAMRLLHHENVVNFIDYLENVDYTNSLGQTYR
jgi:serine/threonine protein kinase